MYQDASGQYVALNNTAGYSYVPVSFSYSSALPGPTVTITSPVSCSAYTGSTITYSATVVPAQNLTVASVQFQVSSGGAFTNYGPAQTQAPYTTQESTSSLAAGLNTLHVVATDSAGSVTTSSVSFYGGAASSGGSLISGFSGTVVRNNYSGFVGLEFAVGASPVTVTSLGRVALPGNSGSHTLKLVNAQTSQDVTGGSVPITMTSGNGTTFEFAALPAPVTLSANTAYLLLSSETSGGDTWYDYSPVTGVANGTGISGAVYSDSGGRYVLVPNTANYSYVPVNLMTSSAGGVTPESLTITSPANNSIFTLGTITFSSSFSPAALNSGASVQYVLNGVDFGAPVTTPPFTLQVDSGVLSGTTNTLAAVGTDAASVTVTSAPVNFQVATDTLAFIQSSSASSTSLGNLTGQFFGMEFTVGPAPLKVQALGIYANTLVTYRHVTTPAAIKLVDAATGLDVPGGSVSFDVPGPVLGYAYSSLAAPITLQANKSYYLVTPSLSGGSAYLLAPLATSVATVNYPVYQTASNSYVVAINAPGYSY